MKTNAAAASFTAYVGIDVSKDTLDVHLLPSATAFSCRNDRQQCTALLERFSAEGLDPASTLVVLEASGGYQTAAAAALWHAGYQVAVVNPQRVRNFARALGYAAKTDAIDAAVLAEFARMIAPRATPVVEQQQQLLRDLVVRRQQIVGMITTEKNRLGTAPQVNRNSIRAVIAFLEGQLAEVETEIDTLIQSSPEWRRLDDLLQSFKGIATKISRVLIGNLSELGALSHKQIAALVGLAPFNHDSGRFRGKRFIRGGRSDVRAALFLAARTAARWNPVIKLFAERLTAAGKTYNQVMIACAHKILTILNAMVRNDQPFQPA